MPDAARRRFIKRTSRPFFARLGKEGRPGSSGKKKEQTMSLGADSSLYRESCWRNDRDEGRHAATPPFFSSSLSFSLSFGERMRCA